MELKLGTRASALALTQSRHVAALLERAQPGLRVVLIEISTTGDRVTGVPLASFGGAGVFVKELENALLDRRIDLAVHSLKDVPTRQPAGLTLAAISAREDVRDAVVAKDGRKLSDLPAGSVVGSGSLRRRAQLRMQFPHLQFSDIRGNVETRIRKVDEGQFAATVLAYAGLRRLKLDGRVSEVLALEHMLPAPGQGALALECRADDTATLNAAQVLHDGNVAACVTAERSLLEALGGGCHLPLGALGIINGSELYLRAALGDPDRTLVLKTERRGPVDTARELGQALAVELLAAGGKELIAGLADQR
jgi:hydroxymethylbilane synthase